MSTEPTPELTEGYVNAIREFLARYPSHASAARLATGSGSTCRAARVRCCHRRVQARRRDPALAVRAVFGSLQSEFELLREARTKPEREALAERIGADIERFQDKAALLKKQPNRGACASRVRGHCHGVPRRAPEPARSEGDAGIDTLLQTFRSVSRATRSLSAGRAHASRALRRLGRFSDAEALVRSHAGVLVQDGRSDLVESLGSEFMKAGTRLRKSGATEDARSAETVGGILFETLPDETAGQTRQTDAGAPLRIDRGDDIGGADVPGGLTRERPGLTTGHAWLARVAEERQDLAAATGY